MMSLSNKYALSEEVILDKLADRVKTEIKPQKVADRKPGDDLKPTMNEVARQTGIDRTAISLIANRKIKSLPSLTTLMKLCNAFDCELEYLLGFQEHKKKAVGSVTDITGLSEEVVEALAEDIEEQGEIYPYEDPKADNFLEYLILNQARVELFARIGQEAGVVSIGNAMPKNSKSYRIAKEAFNKAQAMGMHDTPILKLMGHPGSAVQQRIYPKVLAGMLEINTEDVDEWAINEFGKDANYLFRLFELEQTRAERIRVIEDCFTDLVKDYLREEENNAKK